MKHAGIILPSKLLKSYNDFCKLRFVNQEDMGELIEIFTAHSFPRKYKNALFAFAWQLRLLIQHHGLGENEMYGYWCQQLENKPSFLKRLFRKS